MILITDALIIVGLGCLWTGWLVFSNAGLPRQLRTGQTPTAEKGTEKAFMLFWMDQYCWFGLMLIAIGVVAPLIGVLGFI